jgi:hypothetical protein
VQARVGQIFEPHMSRDEARTRRCAWERCVRRLMVNS